MDKLNKAKNFYLSATNKLNNFVDKVFVRSDKKGLRKAICSITSILFGLLIAGMFITIQGKSFLGAYSLIIKDAFVHGNWRTTMIYASGFVLFGLSVAFSFKAGLFNIGGSGQMLLSGGVSIYYLFSIHSLSGAAFFGAFIICILMGFLLASISGILKTYFNIHEVVSTILLNWIAYYIAQQLFKNGTAFYSGMGEPSSHNLDGYNGMMIPDFIKDNAWIIALSIALIPVIIVWFIFKKTIFGFNLKVVGESQNVARYSGINVKVKTILIMGISGILAGLGGGVLYLLKIQRFSPLSTLPTFGFDGIVITLLALNSPFGILFSSLFYAMLYNGRMILSLEMNLGEEIYQIIVGIVIYVATISVILTNLKPIYLIKKFIILNKIKGFKELQEKFKKDKLDAKSNYQENLKEAKLRVESNKVKLIEAKVAFKEKLDKQKHYHSEDTTISSGQKIIEQDRKIALIKEEYYNEISKLGFYLKIDAKSSYRSNLMSIKNLFALAKKEIMDTISDINLRSWNTKFEYDNDLADQIFKINIFKNKYNANVNEINRLLKIDENHSDIKGLKEKNKPILKDIEEREKQFEKDFKAREKIQKDALEQKIKEMSQVSFIKKGGK